MKTAARLSNNLVNGSKHSALTIWQDSNGNWRVHEYATNGNTENPESSEGTESLTAVQSDIQAAIRELKAVITGPNMPAKTRRQLMVICQTLFPHGYPDAIRSAAGGSTEEGNFWSEIDRMAASIK